MFKIAAVLWIIIGTTLAGTGVVTVLAVPELAAQSAALIPMMAIIGFGVAIPASMMIAKRIANAAAGRA